MKDYRDVIKRVDQVVNNYFKCDLSNGNALNEYLKLISSCLYYLESVRSEIHDKWQSKVKEKIDEGFAVSRAENIAYVEFPEMYELRRIMTSGYKIQDAIRTNISYLKQEINNSN